jgi:hypothetical protein
VEAAVTKTHKDTAKDVACSRINDCSMVDHLHLDTARERLMWEICRTNPNQCARRKLREKGLPVPDDLLPDGERLG